MLLPAQKRSQDKQVERSLRQFDSFHPFTFRFYRKIRIAL
jgi:hypothetical protein